MKKLEDVIIHQMSKTERYNLNEDLYQDVKRHDNPNHWGHHKNQVTEGMAEEELKNYQEGNVFINLETNYDHQKSVS